ncbi:YihY/virulence factor BrkB family protein [Thermodesulfobacteriota bacterium]
MSAVLKNKLKISDFFKTGIWRIRLKDLPRKKSFAVKQLRIIFLTIHGFSHDKCPLRASALTFYSLLSIVPVAALAFGIAKGFGFAKRLETLLYEKLPGQEEVLTQVIAFANTLLENTKGGVIAGIGIAVLLWSVIKVLSHIEGSFNAIWEIRRHRSIGRKISDYLSIMLVCPVLFIMSSSVTVFITTQIKHITEKVALIGLFSPIIFFFLKLIPYGLIWVLFTTIYIFLPNTRVNYSSGIIAGVVAGTLYQIVQWAYINFQVLVAKYNAIYGSFAALPLFLIWLQISWLIVLFGAEISFSYQNVHVHEFDPEGRKIAPALKKLLALQIVHLLVKKFSKGEKPLTTHQISYALEIPFYLTRKILDELVESGVVSSTAPESNNDIAFQPSRDINLLTVNSVIQALEHAGIDDFPMAQTTELQALSEALQTFGDEIDKSPANRLLKDI